MKTLTELRELTIPQLEEQLLVIRKDLFKARMDKATGALQNTHIIRDMKRTIARVKTIITEKAGSPS